jgi:hypothetical protein
MKQNKCKNIDVHMEASVHKQEGKLKHKYQLCGRKDAQVSRKLEKMHIFCGGYGDFLCQYKKN